MEEYVMNTKMKRILAAALCAALAPVSGALPMMSASAAPAGTLVRLNPAVASPFNNGEFQGWGTSLCWWANRLGYSEALTQQAAQAFFSEEGLGLDIARYNLGGGDNPMHDHITRSDSAVPGVWDTFTLSEDGKDVASITYDLTKDQNQFNIAKAALAANPNLYFEGFSNSAPYFMTKTGCTGGGDPASSNNLKDDMYDDFGKFIADATKLFKDQGIEFKSYSPMNEPDTDYWGVGSWKQEGCHFDPGESESKMIIETRKALDAAGLNDVLVAGMDETDINKSVANYAKLSDEAKTALGRIDTHTYGGNQRAALKQTAINAGKDLWMSEVDGGWNGFGLADRIILDLNEMQSAAWVMWDIVDSHRDSSFTDPSGNKTEADRTLDVTGTLWGVGMGNHDTQTLELSNKYYAFGQFTKYIVPGDTLIASSGSSLAAYNRKTGDIKIVVNNSSGADKPYVFDLSAFTNPGEEVEEIRSNNLTGVNAEHWAKISGEASIADKKLTTTAKAGTVTTYVIKGAGPTDYAYITGGSDKITLGGSVQLGVDKSFDGDVIWSSSNDAVASVSADGVVTANAAGDVTITAKIGEYSFTRDFNVPLYALSGTASWGNDKNRPADSADYTKVADGDLSTYFDGTTGGWVRYDFGTPFKPSVIKLAARSGSGMADRTKGAKIQGSNDGISWTDIYTLTAAIPADAYTEVTADKLTDKKAYRYFRYINETNMANVAEFLIEGAISTDTPEGAPVIRDIKEFTDNFDSGENIFGAPVGEMAEGNIVFPSGLARFENVFAPIRATGTAAGENAIELTEKDMFRLEFDMFAGWESNGKDNTFAIKDKDGNEIAALYITGGGYTLNQVRIGGENVLASPAVAQCRSNPGTSKAGANGWGASGQPYVNTVGYNKHVTITIDGQGSVNIAVTGGIADTTVSGVLKKPVTIKSIEATGDYAASWARVVGYDNFDGDVITYADAFAEPTPMPTPSPTPKPTDPPVMPADKKLIGLDFENGDLTSSSTYGKAEGNAKYAEIDGRKCVQFDGTAAGVLSLLDSNGNGLLAGQDEFTVKFSFKQTSSGTSWWFFAAPNDNAQDYQNERYIGALGSGGKLSVERYMNTGSRSAAASGAYRADEWNDAAIVMTEGEMRLYINDELVDTKESAFKVSDMLGADPVVYIGKANWGTGEFAAGYVDDLEVYAYAMDIAVNPLTSIDLGDIEAVTEDITLPTEADGAAVTWSSSDESVIAPDGKVTRPAGASKTVVLTASAEQSGKQYTKEFEATVVGYAASIDDFTAYADGMNIVYKSSFSKENEIYDLAVAIYDKDGRLIAVEFNKSESTFAAMEGTFKLKAFLWKDMEPMREMKERTVTVKAQEDGGAYLFVHFIGSESNENEEQIYFSVSEDGKSWKTLNSKQPILKSNLGEKGVRDPHIIRGEDGRFFIIATDLSIYNRRDDKNRWASCQTAGSKSIVIWESADLVHWSEARIVEVADKNAGCTWAPEAVYDAEKGMYMVFWASKVSDDNYAVQRIYRAYTSDFVTFTEPELYIDGGNISNIDTTITSYKGVYYRFTKNESKSSVTMMASTSLDDGWKDVATYAINGVAGNTITGYEGPTIYKHHGEDRWTLLLDYYSKSQGYKPFDTTDITKGEFTSASDFTTEVKLRHGTVMPITKAEYEALVEAY